MCGSPTIAKCGAVRVHHWAHKGERHCDTWWEPETDWHRGWKDRFQADWQEVILRSQTGEKHISDVRTERGLTLEFQFSHLRPEERMAREKFYGSMVWVVSGTRLKRDAPRFAKGMRNFHGTPLKGVYRCHFPEESFPTEWTNSVVPVCFDFEDASTEPGKTEQFRGSLWCLLPGRVDKQAVVVNLSKDTFVARAKANREPIPSAMIFARVFYPLMEAQRRRAAISQAAALQALAMQSQALARPRYRRRFRRF